MTKILLLFLGIFSLSCERTRIEGKALFWLDLPNSSQCSASLRSDKYEKGQTCYINSQKNFSVKLNSLSACKYISFFPDQEKQSPTYEIEEVDNISFEKNYLLKSKEQQKSYYSYYCLDSSLRVKTMLRLVINESVGQ